MMASSQQFEQVEQTLATDLVCQLKAEHEREINALWEEQLAIREILEQTVVLMQDEILPREKQMHDEIERMQAIFDNATKALHTKLGENAKKAGLSDQHRMQLSAMADPLTVMENELHRIDALLSHDVVKPNIRGWQPTGASAYPREQYVSGASMQYKSQAAARTYSPKSQTAYTTSPTRSPTTSRFATAGSTYTSGATSSFKATTSYTNRTTASPSTTTFSTGQLGGSPLRATGGYPSLGGAGAVRSTTPTGAGAVRSTTPTGGFSTTPTGGFSTTPTGGLARSMGSTTPRGTGATTPRGRVF